MRTIGIKRAIPAVVLGLTISSISIISHPPLAQGLSEDDTISLPLVVAGIPVRIDHAFLKDRVTSEIKYQITNLSGNDITDIKFRILYFDQHKNFKRSEQQHFYMDEPGIKPHSSRKSYFYLSSELRAKEHIAITVEEVVCKTGVWSVDAQSLERAVNTLLYGKSTNLLEARFEEHISLTERDKSEIFRSTLEKIFSSEDLKDTMDLDSSKQVILFKDNLDFNFDPQIRGTVLVPLDANELQKRADAEGEIRYLYLHPMNIEGGKVKVDVAYRNLVGTGKVFTPNFGGHVFEFYKENGKWIGKHISKFRV